MLTLEQKKRAWAECKHEWEQDLDDYGRIEGHTEMVCAVCGCPGMRVNATGLIQWPTA